MALHAARTNFGPIPCKETPSRKDLGSEHPSTGEFPMGASRGHLWIMGVASWGDNHQENDPYLFHSSRMPVMLVIFDFGDFPNSTIFGFSCPWGCGSFVSARLANKTVVQIYTTRPHLARAWAPCVHCRALFRNGLMSMSKFGHAHDFWMWGPRAFQNVRMFVAEPKGVIASRADPQ